MKATEYGLKNIARSFDALKDAMAVPGDNFDNLRYMFGQLLDQRDRMLNHVAGLARVRRARGSRGGGLGSER